jgi:hypothetical protein
VTAQAWAQQTGTVYRFRADTLVGTVWVLGDNARREIEAGEEGRAAGRVEIWRDGGKQVFVLNPQDRTYYEDVAFRTRTGLRVLGDASAQPLAVSSPFQVDGVEKVQVEVKTSPREEVVSGYPCRRSVLTFSYTLKLTVVKVNVSMPGRFDGSVDFCLMDAPNAPRLPFGHGLELRTGHPEVDAAVAERLGVLRGLPVARLLSVTRRIDNGQAVIGRSVLLLSDIRETEIAADRFEVPKNYRFQEPVITMPSRITGP